MSRWDDPKDIRRDELLEDHDAELGEHDRAIDKLKRGLGNVRDSVSDLTSKVTRNRDDIDEIKERVELGEITDGVLFDEIQMLKEEKEHVEDYLERVKSGEAKGRGPYRCSICKQIGHNARQHE